MQSILQYRKLKEDSKKRSNDQAIGAKPGSEGCANTASPGEQYGQGSDKRSGPQIEGYDHRNEVSLKLDKEVTDVIDIGAEEKSATGLHFDAEQTSLNLHYSNFQSNEVCGVGNTEGEIIVDFEGPNDIFNPRNWPFSTRLFATLNVCMTIAMVNIAASIDSPALQRAAKEFGVSETTESLATGLFLVGLGIGSPIAGPLSEGIGRNPVYIITTILFMIFTMGAGLATSIGSQLTCRFLAGLSGSTSLTCAGGSIADLWGPAERIGAFALFTSAGFMGPVIGAVVGGWIVQDTNLSWRWTEWTSLFISTFVLISITMFQPETNHDTILLWKAKHLRQATGDKSYVAKIETRAGTLWARLILALYRPFILTIREIIVALSAIYLAVVFIILFGFLHGYTYIFGMTYGLSIGLTGTCFLGLAVGLLASDMVVIFIYQQARKKLSKSLEEGEDRLEPEFHLLLSMMGGSVSITISLFWMAWTSYPTISIWSPLVASSLFGFGLSGVFMSTSLYILDSYEAWAASALATLSLVRYIAAGAMVVVGVPFYRNLGAHYTLTILGSISAILAPIPYVFYVFGPRLRKLCTYAPTE